MDTYTSGIENKGDRPQIKYVCTMLQYIYKLYMLKSSTFRVVRVVQAT